MAFPRVAKNLNCPKGMADTSALRKRLSGPCECTIRFATKAEIGELVQRESIVLGPSSIATTIDEGNFVLP